MNRIMLRERVKWLLFPGLNFHSRLRYRVIPKFFGSAAPGEVRFVLDAGCGHGMLAYQSYLRGNRVIGVSIKSDEVERNRKLFHQYLRIPDERLSFRVHNLYDIESLGTGFHEIICSEVLEHIRRDSELCQAFWRSLRPGGVLHLCCPNSQHPDNAREVLDSDESGGHVRPGYTLNAFRDLLEPIGFQVSPAVRLGGSLRQLCNRCVLAAQRRGGVVASLLVFALVWPLPVLDGDSPDVPFSIYVRALKPA